MKTRIFKLYWLAGKPEIISGPDLGDQRKTIVSAMNNAGIGGGALPALDWVEEITESRVSRETKE